MNTTPNSLPASSALPGSPAPSASMEPAESPLALSEHSSRFGDGGRGEGAPTLHLHLVRYCFMRDRIYSFLVIPELPDCEARVIPCLENRKYYFPDGPYPLRSTYSRRFRKYMPEVCQVPATPELPSFEGRTSGYRTGIRIHLAAIHQQLLGCIGLRYWKPDTDARLPDFRVQLNNLEFIKSLFNSYEITLHVTSIPFGSTPDRPTPNADRITALVCNFPKCCDGTARQFIQYFYSYAIFEDSYCRHTSAEDDAYRASLGSLHLAYCGEYPYTL